MTTLTTIDAATTADGAISLNDLLYELKLTQRLAVLEGAVQDILIVREVAKQGITVSDQELQQEGDALRRSMGLHRAVDTHKWLRDHSMTLDDLEEYLTRVLAGAKLKERLAAGEVESYFAANRPKYDSARIRRIVVQNGALAQQIVSQLKDRKADFERLALENSLDQDSRDRGGAVGRVFRMYLEPQVAAAVFLANPGDVVGPIQVGSAYHIVRVEEITRAKLDDATTALVKDAVFKSWLDEQAVKRKVQFRLPQLITMPSS